MRAYDNHKDDTLLARRPEPIEIETTIINNDPDAIQAWVEATELLFRLKARREARLNQEKHSFQNQQDRD